MLSSRLKAFVMPTTQRIVNDDVARRRAEEVRADPARDEHERGERLAGELPARAEAPAEHVVEQADHEGHRAAQRRRASSLPWTR